MTRPTSDLASSNPSSSFCSIEQRGGRWWFTDSAGARFLSAGVNAVRLDADRIRGTSLAPYAEHSLAKHCSEDAWRRATAGELLDWGFNTLGAWSDPAVARAGNHPLTYCGMLNLGEDIVRAQSGSADGGAWLHGTFPDVFDPGFAGLAREAALARRRGHEEDSAILGWFLDNELRWGSDWRSPLELLPVFLNLPRGRPGREAARAFLRTRYTDVAEFDRIWKTSFASWAEADAADEIPAPWTRDALYLLDAAKERSLNQAEPARERFFADCETFLGLVAEEYFRVASAALKSASPRHLNLGCRFAYVPPAPVIAAAARHVDVLSFNCYERDPLPVIEIYGAYGRPMLIGEFSFRSEDSGLPNTKGAGPWVKNQEERAAAFEHYVRRALSHPAVVGYHWFKHVDQPKEGRFDGENSNYGITTITGEVYAPLAAAMIRVNALTSAPRA